MQPLTDKEWGKHYGLNILGCLEREVQQAVHSVQTIEILKLTKENNRILEVGCGSGASSLALALQRRKVTALDLAEDCVQLVETAASRLGIDLSVRLWDAQQDLPFSNDAFDVIFHAGLLEHFKFQDRVRLLKLWSRVGQRMISMVPNAACLAYRVGKARAEKAGKWPYGFELPLYTQQKDFALAGLRVLDEYTIGAQHALHFLPRWHPLRFVLHYWLANNFCEDICGQGYLLVTIGEKL